MPGLFDIAQLVIIGQHTPKLDESVKFFHEMLGLDISHREVQSVDVRASEDYYP